MTIRSSGSAATDRPARYGKQLTAHLSRRNGDEWHEDEGTGWIQFTDAKAELACTQDALSITLDSPDEKVADTLEDVIARHLVQFPTQDELSVVWTRESR